MGTCRLMIRCFLTVVFCSVMLSAGCSSDSITHKTAPGGLLVVFTSPSWNVSVTQGQSIEFLKEVTGGLSPYTYAWDFDGGANSTSVEDPGWVRFDTPGDYAVKLTVTDAAGVSASATVTVSVLENAADTPPSVRYTVPAYGATNVPLAAPIQVIFTSGVDLSTITDSTFKLHIGGTPVPGTITCSDPVATFTPASGLRMNTLYTATLTTGVKDIAGNDIFASDYIWTFSTIGYTLSAAIVAPASNVTVLEGQSVDFQGSATGGTLPYVYQWNFSGGLPPSDKKDPGSVTFSTRGTYTVVLRVFDAGGHISYAVRTVNVYSTTAGDWTKVSAGRGHTLALKSDGTLWAWGDNTYGQLGNGSQVNRAFPVQIVSADSDWASICAGADYSLAIKADGTLWAWGRNNSGQLGDGTDIDRNSPVRVGTENDWVKVAAGYGHSLAVRADNTLWAWGLNSSGQLGDSTFIDKNHPVQVGPESDWSVVAAGYAHSLAIKKDHTLWSWGLNTEGQLGDGTNVPANVPARVGSENGWIAAVAGEDHSMALRQDGTLVAWGDNTFGQLGNGTTHDSSTPVLVGVDSNWVTVATSHEHTIAIKRDGTLWSWGLNSNGQLGDGTIVNRTLPVQIEPADTWESLATGFGHTGAIKTGGTLWTWGYNASGQLGDRTLTPRLTPVQVKW